LPEFNAEDVDTVAREGNGLGARRVVERAPYASARCQNLCGDYHLHEWDLLFRCVGFGQSSVSAISHHETISDNQFDIIGTRR